MNPNIKTSTRLALAISTAMLLTCVLALSSAFADEQVRSETVKFHDLNVDTPAGVQALYGRIHSAAMRVCSETDPILKMAVAACATTAEANAIESLKLPQLTAYYKVKNGDRTAPLIASR
jgi:UrcA family protein